MSGDKEENNRVVYKEIATQLSSYQCPVLNNTNYTLWALRMKKILMANGVWDLIEGTSTSKEIDVKKDSSASAYLFQGLPEDLQMQVAGCETAKEIWDSLKSRFIGTEDIQQAHSQQLKSEFERLLMKEDESIDSFARKLMSIITKAATCGLTFDEQTKVRKVLNVVPDKFLPVVATIEMIGTTEIMNATMEMIDEGEVIRYKEEDDEDSQEIVRMKIDCPKPDRRRETSNLVYEDEPTLLMVTSLEEETTQDGNGIERVEIELQRKLELWKLEILQEIEMEKQEFEKEMEKKEIAFEK
ncbi:hypothetical protein Tco_0277372 [Tanacetum coccineum]